MLNEFWRKLYDTVGCNSYIATFADPSRKIAMIDTYAYSVDYFNTAAPVTTVGFNQNIIMDSDSDFVCTYFSCAAVNTGLTQVNFNPAVNIQLADKSSGKNYFAAPSPAALMAGVMGFPFILTSPRVIKPRTTLNLSFASAQPAQTFDGFFFTLAGGRIFYE